MHTANSVGVKLKLAAMAAKADFLKGRLLPKSKSRYRKWYAYKGTGASKRGRNRQFPLARWIVYILASLIALAPYARQRNVRNLFDSIMETQEAAEPLFTQWPAKSVPLAVVLVFASGKERDRCRSYLETNNVFCAVHWTFVRADPRVSDLSARILSIPADHRYGDADMASEANILAQWKRGKTSSN